MHDELTKIDIEKMRQEIAERKEAEIAQLAEVERTRAYGDLSENAEYKCAKQELNRNRSRIRYLENMIRTAKVISTASAPDVVGLFDTIEVYIEDEDVTETYRIVTTLRNDGDTLISKESPLGKALLGRRVGDVVTVEVNDRIRYDVKIVSLKKGEDDPTIPINRF